MGPWWTIFIGLFLGIMLSSFAIEALDNKHPIIGYWLFVFEAGLLIYSFSDELIWLGIGMIIGFGFWMLINLPISKKHKSNQKRPKTKKIKSDKKTKPHSEAPKKDIHKTTPAIQTEKNEDCEIYKDTISNAHLQNKMQITFDNQLKHLQSLLLSGEITDEEYEERRVQLLKNNPPN